MEIYKDLKTQLNKKGIDIIDIDYYDLIQVWKSWYSGNVADFHFYNVLMANGTTCQCERKTMNMPKKLAEDMEKLENSYLARRVLKWSHCFGKPLAFLHSQEN